MIVYSDDKCFINYKRKLMSCLQNILIMSMRKIFISCPRLFSLDNQDYMILVSLKVSEE